MTRRPALSAILGLVVIGVALGSVMIIERLRAGLRWSGFPSDPNETWRLVILVGAAVGVTVWAAIYVLRGPKLEHATLKVIGTSDPTVLRVHTDFGDFEFDATTHVLRVAPVRGARMTVLGSEISGVSRRRAVETNELLDFLRGQGMQVSAGEPSPVNTWDLTTIRVSEGIEIPFFAAAQEQVRILPRGSSTDRLEDPAFRAHSLLQQALAHIGAAAS